MTAELALLLTVLLCAIPLLGELLDDLCRGLFPSDHLGVLAGVVRLGLSSWQRACAQAKTQQPDDE